MSDHLDVCATLCTLVTLIGFWSSRVSGEKNWGSKDLNIGLYL